MATGKSRLEDMHKAKRKSTARVREDLIEKIDASIEQEKKQIQKKQQSACRITKFKRDPHLLDSIEQQFYDQILDQLAQIYPDPSRYTLVAKNLAKIYGLQKKLSEQMELDGGLIISSAGGHLYPHPAIKLIQSNHSLILSTLKSMGLTPSSAANAAEGATKNSAFVSEFAQFQ